MSAEKEMQSMLMYFQDPIPQKLAISFSVVPSLHEANGRASSHSFHARGGIRDGQSQGWLD